MMPLERGRKVSINSNNDDDSVTNSNCVRPFKTPLVCHAKTAKRIVEILKPTIILVF